MNQFDVKLVKWGMIFFTEPATLKLDATRIEIHKRDNAVVLSCEFAELKRANLNSINGMWTFVSSNGQKCNVIIKDDNVNQQLNSSLETARVKGIKI